MTTLDLFTKAKMNIPECARCEDWARGGLSNRCPSCDKLIQDEHERLKELQENPSGMGVLFETGSAKFIKSMSSEKIADAQFVSSWEQASQFEHSKWKADPDSMLGNMNLLYCKGTIKFIALALFHPNPLTMSKDF